MSEIQINVKDREMILFGKKINWSKESINIKHFTDITIDQLNELNEKGLIDLESSQNDSPTVSEFMDFMTKYPTVKAHGYLVSPGRTDNRISLEGILCTEFDSDLKDDFIDLCKHADELRHRGPLYAWWD